MDNPFKKQYEVRQFVLSDPMPPDDFLASDPLIARIAQDEGISLRDAMLLWNQTVIARANTGSLL